MVPHNYVVQVEECMNSCGVTFIGFNFIKPMTRWFNLGYLLNLI